MSSDSDSVQSKQEGFQQGSPPTHLKEVTNESDFKVRLAEMFYPLYNKVYSSDSDFVSQTDKKLSEARVDETAELFISRSLGYGVIGAFIMGVLGTGVSALLVTVFGIPDTIIGIPIGENTILDAVSQLKTPIILLLPPLTLGVLGFFISFYIPHVLLNFERSARERKINFLLPDAVAYMYALSIGGMNQLEIMESVANSEDVYGEVSKEFQSILYETRYFNTDYRTAIRHRAEETPSSELSQFLTDMLSILSSGGDIQSFLDDKTDTHLRTAKEDQRDLIEILELFGEMYLNISLLPLLLLILLTIMQIMGSGSQLLLYAVIYILIPIIGVGFLVLTSTILPDDPGDGFISIQGSTTTTDTVEKSRESLLYFPTTMKYKSVTNIFSQIYKKERNKRFLHILRHPQKLFIERPEMSLGVTVPITVVILVAGMIIGVAPTSLSDMYNGLWPTVYYFFIPMYIIFTPLTIFYRIHSNQKQEIIGDYTEALRKLSSANDTGQTLLESFITVSETSTGRLATEFREISAKVDYDYTIEQAIAEFNNKYQIPEIARINNLIIDAQKTSTQISNVLVTAAQSSENQDKLRRERKSRTRMQVAMLIMTYLILMGVIAMLHNQFIQSIAEVGQQTSQSGQDTGTLNFEAISVTEIGVLYFHGVILQAVTASVLASYLQTNTIKRAGIYIIPLTTIALGVWIVLL